MGISPCGSNYSISPQGREMVAHGTPLFPVAFYNDDLSHNSVPWHWHDEMEAVVVATGATLVMAGRQRRRLEAGQGFFINAGVLHAARGEAGSRCTYHSIVFHPKLIGGDIDSVFWQSYLRPLIASGLKHAFLTGAAPWERDALAAIERAWQTGAADIPGHEFRVRAALSDLVYLLTRQMPVAPEPIGEKARRDAERIKQMLRCIETRYDEPLTVADIAASATISQSECLRCFQSTIGMPPIQYLKRYRVLKAAELLGASDAKITDISGRCGFQDSSYFTRAFREIKGMTPGEYRRLGAAEPPENPVGRVPCGPDHS